MENPRILSLFFLCIKTFSSCMIPFDPSSILYQNAFHKKLRIFPLTSFKWSIFTVCPGRKQMRCRLSSGWKKDPYPRAHDNPREEAEFATTCDVLSGQLNVEGNVYAPCLSTLCMHSNLIQRATSYKVFLIICDHACMESAPMDQTPAGSLSSSHHSREGNSFNYYH
ncbi:hypothetical protein NC652_000174 [Populus alba x Populus x berolinensis]|nr:hypothetical protein NC652_000174 [Populus alba x Populus x berolinensis]